MAVIKADYKSKTPRSLEALLVVGPPPPRQSPRLGGRSSQYQKPRSQSVGGIGKENNIANLALDNAKQVTIQRTPKRKISPVLEIEQQEQRQPTILANPPNPLIPTNKKLRVNKPPFSPTNRPKPIPTPQPAPAQAAKLRSRISMSIFEKFNTMLGGNRNTSSQPNQISSKPNTHPITPIPQNTLVKTVPTTQPSHTNTAPPMVSSGPSTSRLETSKTFSTTPIPQLPSSTIHQAIKEGTDTSHSTPLNPPPPLQYPRNNTSRPSTSILEKLKTSSTIPNSQIPVSTTQLVTMEGTNTPKSTPLNPPLQQLSRSNQK